MSKIDADGANLSNEISELSDKIVALESAYKNADNELKSALEAAYKADDAVLASAIEELQNKLNTLKANLEKADADIIADISKVREELAEVEVYKVPEEIENAVKYFKEYKVKNL